MSQNYCSIKENVLRKLQDNMSELKARFGIASIGIFGSVSRGEDTPESDVDVLYKFADDESVSTDTFLAFADFLEEMLGRKVDLVSVDYIDPYIKKYVDDDAIFCNTPPASV